MCTARTGAPVREAHGRPCRDAVGRTERLRCGPRLRLDGRGSPTPVARPAVRRKGHEESPPTLRAGDRAQARGGRPPALEQKRHVVIGAMRCANPTRPRGRTPGPDQARGSEPTEQSGFAGPCRDPRHAGDGPMERRILAGASPVRKVARRPPRGAGSGAQPNVGPNRRGLTPLSRFVPPAPALAPPRRCRSGIRRLLHRVSPQSRARSPPSGPRPAKHLRRASALRLDG